ncbi:hypothetical protein F5Y16DRAFT_88510 [Xylariaceae sp. FL0255]|nr:hypothetical protein F5Y16DRAFT_88510 [Xylariaceae sp. FL0255]
MDAPQPLFGLLPSGQPLITAPTSQPSATSVLYLIPYTTPSNPKPFSHLAVFLLPGVALPENTAAAIYIAQNPSAFAPGGGGEAAANFKFLGGVGPGKESTMFKLGCSGDSEGVVVGINVEDAASVAERIIQQQEQKQSSSQSQTLTVQDAGSQKLQLSTQVLAQRIIKNAFNFLASHTGRGENGAEVIPLKKFQEWWTKFENKVKYDPSFLEKEQD